MTSLAKLLSPVALLNSVAGDRRVTESVGVAFGAGARDHLDLYRPAAWEARAPVCVFFYGGGWEDGDRRDYRFVGTALAGRGIATVIPDYRLYPEVVFPSFIEDAARAVRWARDNVAGGGPLILAGHSAGAHIAAMLAFDPQWLKAVDMDAPSDIAGLVGLAGPYDFLPLRSDVLRRIFGPEAGLAATQPITFVRATAPPTWLASGQGDKVVHVGNTERLAARLRDLGVPVEAHFYPWISHEMLIGSFARPLRFVAPVLRDVSAFVTRTATVARRRGVAA